MSSLVRTALWRRLDEPGAEMLEVHRIGDGWRLRGVVVLALDGCPSRVRYRLACDGLWRTRAVDVDAAWASQERSLSLAVDEDSRWWSDGPEAGQRKELQAVQGCVDVDLEVTPATNTLPIRRLTLEAGKSSEQAAAWIRFPELHVEPLAQRYTKLGEHRYRYESLDSGFSADLQVDEFGLVVRYSGLWELTASFAP